MRIAWTAMAIMVVCASLAQSPYSSASSSGAPSKSTPVSKEASDSVTKNAPASTLVIPVPKDAAYTHAINRERITDKFNSDYLDTQIRLVEASEKQANAAIAAAVIVGMETFIAVVALYFLRKTYRETRATARASIKSARATMAGVRLARAEFISTHRPRIILTEVSIVSIEGKYQIVFTLQNIGGSKATLVNSIIRTERTELDAVIVNLRAFNHDQLGKAEFAAGQYYDLFYPLSVDDMESLKAIELSNHQGTGPACNFYFAGAVRYLDELQNSRNSVFRRKFKKGAFRSMNDSAYEYAD